MEKKEEKTQQENISTYLKVVTSVYEVLYLTIIEL